MITIVTVYKSNNYGSFLQAKALGDILQQYDEVQYLDFGQRNFFGLRTVYYFWKNMPRGFSLSKFIFTFISFFYNFLFWKKLKSISIKKFHQTNQNIIVVGSDEIWNVSRRNCSNPYFWAFNLLGRKISYAPSINNAQLEHFQKIPTTEYLNDFEAISVRDLHSKNVLSHFTNKNISIVMDPTMLFGIDYYKRMAKYTPPSFKYIALYVYPGANDNYRIIIQKFAREKNLKLVSVGTYLPWCDININPAVSSIPFLYYLDADYVFSNTFHGTAFAINFETEFFAFCNSEKINCLLKTFGLENRNIMNIKYDELQNKSKEKINYEKVKAIKESLRENSIKFIKDSVIK